MAEKIKISKSVAREKNDPLIVSDIKISHEIKKEKKNINFEHVSFWIIAGLVFLMPIFFLPVSVLGLFQTKLSLLALGTLVAFVFFLINKMKVGVVSFTYNPLFITAWLLVLTYFVSSWFGISRYKSFIGSMTEQDTFMSVFILFVFMFLLTTLARTPKRIFTILSAFLGSVFVVMLAQIIRIVVGHKIFGFGVLEQPSNTLVGGWGDITILSLYFLAILVVVLETVKLKKWISLLLGVTLVIPFFFVVLSGLSFDFYFFSVSLVFIIAIASIILFAYLFSLRRVKATLDEEGGGTETKKTKISASLILLAISIVLVLFGGQVNSYLLTTTGVTYIEGRPSWQSTYNIGTNVLASSPILGSGPNTFDTDWSINRDKNVNNYIFWNNEYSFGIGFVPTSAVTVGIVGFVLWLLFYVLIFIRSFRTLFGSKEGESGSVVHVVVAVGAILTSLTMIFYAPGIVVLFANVVFVGLLYALGGQSSKTKNINLHNRQWHNFASTIVYIVVLVVAVYLIYVVAFKALANTYYRGAVLGSDTGASLVLIQKAINTDPSQALYYETAAQIYAAKVSNILSLSKSEVEERKEEINNYIVNAINYSVAAEQTNQLDYKPKIMTGKLLEFFGSLGLKDANQGAVQKYLDASANIPTNPLPLLYAANVSMGLGDKIAAKDYLTKAIALKSDYSDVPELGKEIQSLIDQVNKAVVPVEKKATTTKEESN